MASFSLRSVSIGALLAHATLAPSVAVAADPALAKELFLRGRELRLKRDCADAVPLFRRADAAYPTGLGSLRNIAECEESLGHLAMARRAWLDLRERLSATHESKYEGWATDAEQGAARLLPKLATLTIVAEVVGPPGEASGATDEEVWINGQRLPLTALGVPLEQDPGRYQIRLAAPHGGGPQEQVIDLAPGEAKRVILHMSDSEARLHAPVQPVASADARPPQHGASTKTTAAWVALGLGGASLVAAGVEGWVRQSAADDLNGRCPMGTCTSSKTSLAEVTSIEDRGKTASTLVTVFLTAGCVAASAGVVLFAMGQSASRSAAVVLSPGGIGARGSF